MAVAKRALVFARFSALGTVAGSIPLGSTKDVRLERPL